MLYKGRQETLAIGGGYPTSTKLMREGEVFR